jgi:hypothetical protein
MLLIVQKTEICSDVFIIEYLFKYIYKGNVRLQVKSVSTFYDNEMDSRIPNTVRKRVKEEMKKIHVIRKE